MRSKSYLFLLLVVGLAVLSGVLYSQTKYNYGLDVKGGVRFVYQMDTSKLTREQRQNLGEVRQRLLKILSVRTVGSLGVTEPTVVAKGTDQFEIDLPGMTDPEKAQQVIGTSARIEFYHARNVVTPIDQNRRYSFESNEKSNPPEVDFTRRTDPTHVIKYKLPDGSLNPEYQEVVKGWDLILSGDELANAQAQAVGGGYEPVMSFSSAGAAKMEQWCRRWNNRQENLASVLDGRVLSIAHVRENTILSDNAVIEGNFSPQYVKNLVDLLNGGALPVDLHRLSSETVDPTIGSTALDAMVMAGLIAFGVIAAFLLVYYAFPGLIAVIALSLYVLFTLTVLKLIGATFSLAAIAGFILSVGMAVDANILVFERFKEEMKAGKSLASAINLGFRRALPAIVDSNACTILTSLVLLQLGTGPVKGFATTLIIGVAISLFTAVTVTRSLLVFFVGSGVASNPKWFAADRSWFKHYEEKSHHEPLQVVNKATKWFLVSGVSIALGLPFIFMGGLRPNVEFRGGTEAVFSMTGSSITADQILSNLAKNGFEGSNVKFGTFTPQNLVVTVPKNDKVAGAANDTARGTLIAESAGLSNVTPSEVKPSADGGYSVTFPNAGGIPTTTVVDNLDKAGITGAIANVVKGQGEERAAYLTIPPSKVLSDVTDIAAKKDLVAKAAGIDIARNTGFTEIGPAIQAETLRNAVLAVLISSGLIIVFLAFRFGIGMGGFAAGLRFGVAAVGALLHDILFVLGMTAIVGYFEGWEISALFITSMLTIIGFSVHDTIVIFDRIRENLHRIQPGEDMGHLMNRSITQSFARSINTSATVVLTLVIMLAFGTKTPDLKLFCATMLAGIISGTYSSIYNASPILYLWDRAAQKRRGEAGTLVGIMRDEIERTAVITTRAASSDPIATPTNPNAVQGGRTYGQVRRRASDAQRRGSVELDDDE